MVKVITAQQLCDFAEAMLGQCYWYGCFSQIGTEKLYKEKLAQFPSQIGKWPKSTYTAQYGKRVMDCSGLIKAAAGTKGDPLKIPTYADIAKFDWSADTMISKCTDVVDFKNILRGQIIYRLPKSQAHEKLVKRCLVIQQHQHGAVCLFPEFFNPDSVAQPCVQPYRSAQKSADEGMMGFDPLFGRCFLCCLHRSLLPKYRRRISLGGDFAVIITHFFFRRKQKMA